MNVEKFCFKLKNILEDLRDMLHYHNMMNMTIEWRTASPITASDSEFPASRKGHPEASVSTPKTPCKWNQTPVTKRKDTLCDSQYTLNIRFLWFGDSENLLGFPPISFCLTKWGGFVGVFAFSVMSDVCSANTAQTNKSERGKKSTFKSSSDLFAEHWYICH